MRALDWNSSDGMNKIDLDTNSIGVNMIVGVPLEYLIGERNNTGIVVVAMFISNKVNMGLIPLNMGGMVSSFTTYKFKKNEPFSK